MDQAVAQDASDVVRAEEEHQRLERVGGLNVITMDLGSNALENIPAGQVADRCFEFIRDNEPETVYRWQGRNRVGLTQVWAVEPGDALKVKAEVETKTAEFIKSLTSDEVDATIATAKEKQA